MNEGLRERKKRQTRSAIAAAAMELFTQRGFEDVTVAEVAQAADVSEKTVFNYFPTKEELVFSGAEDRLDDQVDAVRNRVPGLPLSRVFEQWTMGFLDELESGSLERILAITMLVRRSPSLRDRLLLAFEREAAVLVAAVSDDEDDIVAQAVVRSLVWTHRVVFRTAVRRVLQGEDRAVVAADLRIQAHAAYERLDQGLARYGG
jgi:AcrR family transcriptional regulator